MPESETETADDVQHASTDQHPFDRTVPSYLKAGWGEADARALPGGR